MAYTTLMVHLTLGRSNTGLLRIAGDLAARFQAQVIGVAACQPMQMVYGEGYVDGTLFQQDRLETERELAQAEAEFLAAMQARGLSVEWRASVMFGPLAEWLANQARCADLVISAQASADLLDASRTVDSGDLVLQVGRPVLMVPAGLDTLALDRVLVGWKDGRESRRAVSDALPLLQQAGQVTLVEVAAQADCDAARRHLADVAGWLQRHGVTAQTRVAPSTGDDTRSLHDIAGDERSDLIVAGAYGHSRLREWVLGGMTRDLLLRSPRCTLVSH
jgi:nucleotide-binding universal stress UspA family protein